MRFLRDFCMKNNDSSFHLTDLVLVDTKDNTVNNMKQKGLPK